MDMVTPARRLQPWGNFMAPSEQPVERPFARDLDNPIVTCSGAICPPQIDTAAASVPGCLRSVVVHAASTSPPRAAQRVVLRLPVHYTGILNTSILGAVTLQICSTLLRASLLTHLYTRKHHVSQSR